MPSPLTAPHGAGKAPAAWLARTNTINRVVQVNVRKVLAQTLFWGLAFAVLLALPFALYYQSETRSLLDMRKAEQERTLHLAREIIRHEVDMALSDLRFLAQSNEIALHLELDSPASRGMLASEFLRFARQKRVYDQVRFIGADGMEKVRVNYGGGNPHIVPDAKLQHKGHRDYFKQAMALDTTRIHVSPFDLNRERSGLERPYKPVIRFAIPVTDRQGRKQGLVVLNYIGGRLLERLSSIGGTAGGIWLLNGQGYWLLGPTPDSAWGFDIPERRAQVLSLRYPELWRQIAQRDKGEHTIHGDWIRFERIHPLANGGNAMEPVATPVAAKSYSWIIATVLPAGFMAAVYEKTSARLGIMYAVWALFAFALAGGIAFLGNRNEALALIMERVVDNVPVLIAYVDTERCYRFNNMAYQRFFGLSPRQLFGKTLREVLGEASYQEMLPFIDRALAGETVVLERRLSYARAGEHDVVISYLPDIWPGGQVKGFYVLVSDVTPIRESERRERQRLLELAHVSRLASLGEMASQIAHEVNQPLAAIAMYSTACLRVGRKPEDADKVHSWLEAINAQASRASEVVRHLRRFVRKGDIQAEPVDLNQVVQEIAALMRAEVDRHEIALDVEPAAGMPLLAAEMILVDQVLFNLVRNALEALSGRGGEGRIVLRTGFDEHQAWVEVVDNGPGVNPCLGDTIFEPFKTDKEGGLGMGLAISRSIVQAHGGTLGYVDNPGGGAVFRCAFPRKARP